MFTREEITLFSFNSEKSLYLKGIMSLFIVLCHFSVFAGLKMPMGGRLVATGLPIVAVFFFLSGYGLKASLDKKGISYLHDSFSKRMKKLLVPFIIVNIINAIVYSLLGIEFPSMQELIGEFIYMSPFLMFSWFVYALFFLYVLFYISYRFVDNKYISLFLLTLFVIGFIVYAYNNNVFILWRSTVLSFPLGILFASYENTIKTFLQNNRIICLCFYSVLLVLNMAIFALLRVFDHPEYPDTYLGFFVVNYIPFILVICSYFININAKLRIILALLGGISYEIYLVHGVVLLDYWFCELNIYVQILYLYSVVLISAYLINVLDKRLLR